MTAGRMVGILVAAAVAGIVVGAVSVQRGTAPGPNAAASDPRASPERSRATGALTPLPATLVPARSPERSGPPQPTVAMTSIPLAAAASPTIAVPASPSPPTQPQPTTVAVTSPPFSVAPRATPEPRGRSVVFFAVPGARPVAVDVAVAYVGPSASDRIFARLRTLPLAAGGPPEAVNVASAMKARLIEVTLETKERVIVDFSVPSDGWGVGADRAKLLAQQLVFTATEEEGVVTVLVTQNGGKPAVIAGDASLLAEPRGRADLP